MAKHMLKDVGLLGLNEFGDPVGMSPLWGMGIGGGVTALTSLTLGHVNNGKLAANREAWGFGAGMAASVLLYAMKATRHAAFGSVLGTLFAGGIPLLEKLLLGTVQLPAPAAAAAVAAAQGTQGVGMAKVQYLNGLGIPQIKQLGMPTIQQQPKAYGTIPGVAGTALAGTQIGRTDQPPVQLLGPQTQTSQQVQLLGGPSIHGLSAAYGATVFGGGR